MLLDSLAQDDLRALGLSEPDLALAILKSLAGAGVTDEIVDDLLPSILESLRDSPDPDRALLNFARWTDSVTSRYTHFQYLLRHPSALAIFFNVCGVSQFFSDILIRNPEYFEILANPGVRGAAGSAIKPAAAYHREISAFVDGVQRLELKLEAMRRFKQREVLRIGARDILGLADMPATAGEFSNLADACIQKALEIGIATLREEYPAVEPAPFVVIGMGKLGGQELNYSSDIDLMFVCADAPESDSKGLTPHTSRLTPLEYAHKLAEFVINALSRNLQNGHLFRVDMRLRPEGRFGALVRTLPSYAAYYESWAEPWERQAMIKGRTVAGDARLAEQFQEIVAPFVYRRSFTMEFFQALRENKERIEKRAEIEGIAQTNVKIGFGGIRDVEFAAQILQIQLGGRDPRVRARGTLVAIFRLRQAGALTFQEATELSDDYKFLRTVEHRLQILYERQTQTLPNDPAERRLLARRLGFPDAAAFDAEYVRRTRRVHAHFERIFYGHSPRRMTDADPWRDLLLAIESESALESLAHALDREGFIEPAHASETLKELVAGSRYGASTPEARDQFLRVAARLIVSCARTGDPDSALHGIESVAQAVPNPAAFFRTLAEGEEILDRLVRLAAASPPMIQSIVRRLEWLDLLVSDEVVDPDTKTYDDARQDLESRVELARSEERFWDAVALYIQRERLRIAARDTWGEIDAREVGHELTVLAEAVLAILLQRGSRRASQSHLNVQSALDSLAVIGLGKLGGRELGCASDWDILFVYEPDPDHHEAAHAAATTLAEYILAAGEKLRPRGAPVEIDARLRPEGKKGALVYTPADYRAYYAASAQTWERQYLTRARPIAGSPQIARAFMRAAHESIYSEPLSAEAADEIRAMKRRIEAERLKPDDRWTDVKLGHGGMNDIEFTVQLLQLRHGAAHPQVRLPGTTDALRTLADIRALPSPDALRLSETHSFYAAIRNRLALLGVSSTDNLPAEPRRLRELAIGLGFADQPNEPAEAAFRREFDARMRETRATVTRLFYETR